MLNVLDNIGYVKFLDAFGTDADIAKSARVSYDNFDKDVTEEQDRALIHYLAKNEHKSPFEQCELKLKIKMPIFVARQFVRHRLVSRNELSLRYTISAMEFYTPHISRLIERQSYGKGNVQNNMTVDEASIVQSQMRDRMESACWYYETLITKGVSREVARVVLPLALYTTEIFKINLSSLMNFLKLRTSKHTQWESVQYASAIEKIFQEKFPMAYQAYYNHVKMAKTFSKVESELIRAALDRPKLLELCGTLNMSDKEVVELCDKLELVYV